VVNKLAMGLQWGDEAKGKIVDVLTDDDETEAVVRYQGGANAGHTIVRNGQVFKLRVIPSGVFHGDKICVIGNYCAFNPIVFAKEVKGLNDRGIVVNPRNLFVSNLANITTRYQLKMDELTSAGVGTTNQGIGPTYSDKRFRVGALVDDFLHHDRLEERVHKMAALHDPFLKSRGIDINPADVVEELKRMGEFVTPYIRKDLQKFVLEHDGGLLFEGAQGGMLDCDLGSYDMVTSSNTTIGAVFIGTGTYVEIPVRIGVVKAYNTRVGNGPHPTEISGEMADRIRERGDEYGTVTRRPRRIGNLDLCVVDWTIKTSGINQICLSRLDILDQEPVLQICIGYELNGEKVDYFPVTELGSCKPIYVTVDGWMTDTTKARKESDLPRNARIYKERIEEHLHVPIKFIGVGADSKQMIFV